MSLLLALALHVASQATAPQSTPTGDHPLDEKLLARVEALAREAVDKEGVPGLTIAVGKDGQLVYSKGWGYADAKRGTVATADTTYDIGSLTRQFTAVAVLQLAEKKKLTLDDDLSKWLPEFPASGRKMTLRQLLTNTAGVPGYNALAAKHPKELERELTREQLFALFTDVPFDFAPGAGYALESSGYALLAIVVAKASGQDFREYVRTQILDPIELSNTRFCPMTDRPMGFAQDCKQLTEGRDLLLDFAPPNDAVAKEKSDSKDKSDDKQKSETKDKTDAKDQKNDAKSDAKSAAAKTGPSSLSLCSTAKDLVRWEQALVDRKLIDEKSTREMTTPVDLGDGLSTKSGFAVAVEDGEHSQIYSHTGGIGGSRVRLAHYVTPGLTVVVLTNCASAPVERLEKAVAAAFLDELSAEVVDLPIETKDVERFSGDWQIATTRVRTFAKDGKLWFERPAEPAFALLYQGKNVFVASNDKAMRITFKVPDDGKPAESFEILRAGLMSTGKRMG